VLVGAGHDVYLLRNIPVRDVLRSHPHIVPPSEHLASIVRRLSSNEAMALYVVGPGDRLQGVISMRELRPVLNDIDTLDELVVAADVAAVDSPSVSVDESLDVVLARLDLGYRDELPVVDGDRLLGVVRVEDVLARYRHELARRELAEGLGE
jgi:Mg/Co/Ni transporter MgtE